MEPIRKNAAKIEALVPPIECKKGNFIELCSMQRIDEILEFFPRFSTSKAFSVNEAYITLRAYQTNATHMRLLHPLLVRDTRLF